jgi:hypothetical protein
MNSFCKWSESNLEIQTRVFPSGKPTSNFYIEPYGDLSWEKEHQDFFTKIKNKTSANLTRDFFIQESLKKLNLLEEI